MGSGIIEGWNLYALKGEETIFSFDDTEHKCYDKIDNYYGDIDDKKQKQAERKERNKLKKLQDDFVKALEDANKKSEKHETNNKP